jgi:exopolyphosphatase/guanosine-5'-triphosphate,3'-diphosphate pyrophosphatase
VAVRTLIAAVDLGSNSFHMVVARRAGAHLHVLDRLRERVALAKGLDAKRRLTADAQSRALECLARFGQRLRELPDGAVRAVGTNTLRVASDTRDFLGRCERKLGHPIEIISGREEARLIHLGVAHALGEEPGRTRLVVDVGGGSTECVIGEGFDALEADSLFMGCVTLTERFFPGGAITRKRLERATLAARLELEPIERRYRDRGWSRAVGSSGTVLAIDSVLRDGGWSEGGITRDGLARIAAHLVDAGHVRRIALPSLTAERASVLPGGLAILLAVFDAFRLTRMSASSGALREGLLHDLVGRIRHEDARESAVEDAWERWHVDADHARRVEREALAMLDAISGSWPADDRMRRALSWSARLHEVGLSVAWAKHHEHGAYLVRHSHLPGFSREEQDLAASLIAAHRRKLDPAALQEQRLIPARDALRLAVLLRLAVRLHRSRSPKALPKYSIEARARSVSLTFPRGFLAAHPLTREDLEDEAGQLADAGFRLRVS